MRPRNSSSSCKGLQKYKEADHNSPAARSPGLFDMLPKPAEGSGMKGERMSAFQHNGFAYNAGSKCNGTSADKQADMLL